MASLAPPDGPALVSLDDNDGLNRLRLRVWQLTWCMLTILVTVWLIRLGPIPGVIAVVTAKHVLVAILVMGLGVDAPRPADT